MKYGYFDEERKEYVITRPDTPAPWVNYLGSPEYGAIVSNNAGGETSGAITSVLNFTSFYIGKEIAPGVPTLIPTHQPNFHLILKSGNFGNKEFFLETLEE